jgi:D-sedoheptulose 7-phosphate isomerase
MTTTTPTTRAATVALDHVTAAIPTLEALRGEADRLAGWGVDLADRMLAGARLLAAGNGGSAAEAQHLTAELVGRFDGDRRAFSAICLHGDTSALTAIGNDYGFEEVFARQVTAHGAAGDVLMLLSTSGTSPNLLHAAAAARDIGMTVRALTGPTPNPLADLADDVLSLPGRGANVQEAQLVAIHALCRVFDARIRDRIGASR